MSNILNKEEYLLHVKNAMLLRFRHKDIYLTLEDLNLLFESGVEHGKTELELCDELGTPKDFINNLICENIHHKFIYTFFKYTIGIFTLCMVLLLLFYSHTNNATPLFFGIPVTIIPIFLWYYFGVSYLYRIRKESVSHLKKYSIYFILSLLFIIVQQSFAILINSNLDAVRPFIRITYILSSLLMIVSAIILLVAIYKIYKGYYLALGILTLSLGVICSSLSYNNFLMNFNMPGKLCICSFPYILSIILAAIYFLFISKRKEYQ